MTKDSVTEKASVGLEIHSHIDVLDQSRDHTPDGNDTPSMERFDTSILMGQIGELRKMTKPEPFSLTWRDLSYSVPVTEGIFCKKTTVDKVLLQGLNGAVQSGEVLAVMGTSGAGKTTFMNLMAGRNSPGKITGAIELDGRKRDKYFKKESAYVEQDDVFLSNLTVEETFNFAALLRLPKTLSTKEKKARADEIMTQLGLSDCKHTRIGDALVRGISGGERKRCSIGIELITNPKVLFLDEPTSGLDAFTAYHVMLAIKSLAHNGGRAVMCTIHQPRSNIYDTFDKLLLLSKGKAVYYGPAKETATFFRDLGYQIDYSPADFFLDVTTVDTRSKELEESSIRRNEQLIAAYQTSSYNKIAIKECGVSMSGLDSEESIVSKKSQSFQLNWFAELVVLYQRAFLSIIREKRATVAAYGQAIVMALLCGIVFYQLGSDQNSIQNRGGVLFFITLTQSFGPLLAKLILFHLEKALFKRERASGCFRVSSFYIAKSFAEFPITVWSCWVFGIIVYWMVGLNPLVERFFFFLLVLFIQFFTAESIGLIISAITPNVEVGNALAPIVIIVFMLFGGFYINSGDIPTWLSWIEYISFITYCYRALYINEFEGLTFTCETQNRCVASGAEAISISGFHDNNKYVDIVILFAIGVVCRFLGYLALLFLSKPKTKLH